MIKKHIPNTLTCLNLICGCLAIIATFHKSFELAAALVVIAAIFDFFDGMVARLLNAHSEIGKQLDSLADMVTFGVVPGFIMYQLIIFTIGSQVNAPNKDSAMWYIAYFAFIIPVFSAVRLAKFNIDTRQNDSFIGLPTPANTLFIVSLPMILIHGHVAVVNEWLMNPIFLCVICVLQSYLMNAELPLIALKFKHFKWKENQYRYILILSALPLILLLKYLSVPAILFLYLALSVVQNSKKTITN
jgi:CDP-diacylglycerol--serine O-phosphatidyltransferase